MSEAQAELDDLRFEYAVERLDALEARFEVQRKDMVRRTLAFALRDNPDGPVVYAARLLGITRNRLTRLLKRWGWSLDRGTEGLN